MKPAEALMNRVIVVRNGNSAGMIGRVLGRDQTKRNRLLVTFSGKKFPRDFRSIGADNVREASAVEALLFGDYRWRR
jgi:hypothetical protein